ncbi:MAG TPA: metal-dependent hydrolase [Bacillota bacterium]|nr:metal-dependent hydrolase [Bacillota bacterium]
MDNLTHALIGVTAGRAAAGTVRREPVWWAFLLGSELPDIDALYALQGRSGYLLNHRGWTHSLPGLLLLSAAAALLIFSLGRGGAKYKSIMMYTLSAALIHVLIDVLTSWGTCLFKPFYAGWLSLDVLPMVDPFILLVLFAGLLAGRRRLPEKRAAKLALAAVAIFIAARGGLHLAALNTVAHDGRLLAMPTMNPLKWRVVAEQSWGFETGNLDLLGMRLVKTAEINTGGFSAAGDLTLDPDLDKALGFFRVPVFTIVEREEKKLLVVKDISFERGIREVIFEAKGPAAPGTWYKAVRK